mgnify:CR=1 FL=1
MGNINKYWKGLEELNSDPKFVANKNKEFAQGIPLEEVLTDSDGENSETQVWLEFALSCKYISDTIYQELISESMEIGKLINYMLLNPEKFGVKKE